jgi:hypothetical protein
VLADKEQARLEAEQAAQRQATYEAARSGEEARKQELIAKQQASWHGILVVAMLGPVWLVALLIDFCI